MEHRKRNKEGKLIDSKKPFFANGLPPTWICDEHLVAYFKLPISLSGVQLPCCEIERYKRLNEQRNEQVGRAMKVGNK